MNPIAVAAVSNNNNNNKKRTVNDLVIEAVTRIEKQQYEQSNILERIMQYVALPKQDATPLNPNTSWEFLPPLSKKPRSENESFEVCFAQLLKSFQSIDPNHRAEKVRRVARGLSLVENEALAEFVDMLMTEGLGIEAGREARPTNIYPQHLDIKPAVYATMPQHHAPLHNSHSHTHPSLSSAGLSLSMNKSTGGTSAAGEMEKIDSYFFASMLPNYGQVNVNVSNGEEGYPDFLTASPPPNLPLGNSSDFLNM
jgi:hypothetical protein